MTTEQPLALRLADILETNIWAGVCTSDERRKAAAELRRLHTVNRELVEALQTLANMSATFPQELYKDHPDVAAARTALTKAGEQT